MRSIAFLAAMLSAGWSATSGRAEQTEAAAVSWLDAHQSGLNAPSAAATIWPATWEGKTLFILGAFHGVAENGPIDLAVLPVLQRRAGVRTYVAEISHAHAAYLNRFLITGDSQWLDRVMAGMRGFGDWTVEQRTFWLELRRWNETLPTLERVKIVGIDFERYSPEISLSWLREAVGRVGQPSAAGLTSLLKELADLPPDDSLDQIRTFTQNWSRSLETQSALWDAYLRGDAYDVRRVVENLRQRFECQADPASFDSKREQVFYHNLEREAAHANLGALFCRLGTAHALQRPYAGVSRFAALLQQTNSPWRGKVASIFPLYIEGQNLAVKQGHYRVAPNQDDTSLVGPFAQSAHSGWTLFELEGKGSPFETNRPRPGETWSWANDRPTRTDSARAAGEQLFGGFSGGVTADYLSEILLVKGSHAAHPLAP